VKLKKKLGSAAHLVRRPEECGEISTIVGHREGASYRKSTSLPPPPGTMERVRGEMNFLTEDHDEFVKSPTPRVDVM